MCPHPSHVGFCSSYCCHPLFNLKMQTSCPPSHLLPHNLTHFPPPSPYQHTPLLTNTPLPLTLPTHTPVHISLPLTLQTVSPVNSLTPFAPSHPGNTPYSTHPTTILPAPTKAHPFPLCHPFLSRHCPWLVLPCFIVISLLFHPVMLRRSHSSLYLSASLLFLPYLTSLIRPPLLLLLSSINTPRHNSQGSSLDFSPFQ